MKITINELKKIIKEEIANEKSKQINEINIFQKIGRFFKEKISVKQVNEMIINSRTFIGHPAADFGAMINPANIRINETDELLQIIADYRNNEDNLDYHARLIQIKNINSIFAKIISNLQMLSNKYFYTLAINYKNILLLNLSEDDARATFSNHHKYFVRNIPDVNIYKKIDNIKPLDLLFDKVNLNEVLILFKLIDEQTSFNIIKKLKNLFENCYIFSKENIGFQNLSALEKKIKELESEDEKIIQKGERWSTSFTNYNQRLASYAADLKTNDPNELREIIHDLKSEIKKLRSETGKLEYDYSNPYGRHKSGYANVTNASEAFQNKIEIRNLVSKLNVAERLLQRLEKK